MSDLPEALAHLATGYASALVALVGARWIGTLLARRRPLTDFEARGLALTPPLAFFCALLTPPLALWEPLHTQMHAWMAQIAAAPSLHRLLHLANAGFALALLLHAARTLHALGRYRALQRTLVQAARSGDDTVDGIPIHLLPSERAHCFALGALHPRIFLSTGLLQRLSAREREVVVAHEAAHGRRRDGLWQLAFTLLYSALPLPGAGALRRACRDAAERACDREAAAAVGSPCDVAETLLRVSTLAAAPPGALAIAFYDDPAALEDRIRHLLAGPQRRTSPLGFCLAWLALAALVTVATPALHHAGEWFAFHGHGQ